MKLHEFKPFQGARHRPKRVGRGPGSGHGKTSGRGHKGQKSRSGGSIRPGFEGGQMPFYRKIPKRGFTHIKDKYTIINLEDLEGFEGIITPRELVESGFLKSEKERVKILGDGKIGKPLTIQAHSFSQAARGKIEKAGGKAVVI